MKTCVQCGVTQALENFQKRPDSSDGRRNDCQGCSLVRMSRNSKIRLASPHKCGARGCEEIVATCANRCREHQRLSDMKRLYGVTPEQYDSMLQAQDCACAICGTRAPKGKYGRWQIDHDHETGQVRGLLCQGCNVALGMMAENEECFLRAAEYLRTWNRLKVKE